MKNARRVEGWAYVVLAVVAASCAAVAEPGSIVAWGYNSDGQCDVPEPNADFVAVAGGGYHAVGLKSDGSLVSWGFLKGVPWPNTGFVAISACEFRNVGLKDDGSVVAWAWGGPPPVPEPNTGFVAVSTGVMHSLALKADGSIVAWGENSGGQCDVPEPNTGFVAVAAGHYHSLGLKADGSIRGWGGHWYYFDWGQDTPPEPNTGYVAIAGGYEHSLGLKADGSVVGWGANYRGQCDVPEPNTGFVAITAGELFSVGLKNDGSIVVWGDRTYVPEPNRGFVAVKAGGRAIYGLTATSGLNRAPVLSNPGDQASYEGEVVSLRLHASDVDGDPLKYTAMGLPEGLTLNADTGVIDGTIPMGEAEYNVSVAVSDSHFADSKSFTWTVSRFGDVDHSGGAPNAGDVQLVINAALGIGSPNPAADLDRNGRADAIDVQLILIAVLGL